MKTLIILLILALPLRANSREVTISLFCLKYASGLETVYFPPNADSASVRLSTANLTDPVNVQVDGDRVVLYSQPMDSPETSPAVALQTEIPPEMNRALLILVPDRPGEPTPYRALAINFGDEFQLGSYRIINFSQNKIRGAIGRSFIETESGKMADLLLTGEPGEIQGVKFEYEMEGRWNRLTETRAAVRKDRRWLLCVFRDPGTGRLMLKSIPDRTNLHSPIHPDPQSASN